MITINNHWHIASNDQRKKTELIVTPFQKDGGSRIPIFMRSLLEDLVVTSDKEEGKQKGKKNAEDRQGPMPLNENQRRRTAKFYECWSTCSALIHLTDVEDIYIQHGRLIGRFLLNQLSRLNVNVQFHGFNAEEWPLNDHKTLSAITIHVYHDRAPQDMIKNTSTIEVECFKPNVFFEVPACLQEIIEGTTEDGFTRDHKRKVIVFYNYLNLLEVADKVGVESAIVQNASMFGDQIMAIFRKSFPEAVSVGFPKERLERIAAGSVEFKGKVVEEKEEAPAAPAPKAKKAKPQAKFIETAGNAEKARIEEEQRQFALTQQMEEEQAAKPKKSAKKVNTKAASSDKLAELQAKFGKEVTA
jgi:hypothetical protein